VRPRSSNRRAIASPIPELAPVTTATVSAIAAQR
jgi:hypothetical protein